MSWLVDPFEFDFFVRGVVAGVLLGAMCGALGAFILLRGMSYIGLGVSYSVLGGVGIGIVVGLDRQVSGFLSAAVAVGLITLIGNVRSLRSDAAIGIVSSTMFALGVAVISVNRSRSVNLENLLFGNILGVRTSDIIVLACAAVAVAAALFATYKRLVLVTLDRETAAMHGVSLARMDALFGALLAGIIVLALQVIGVLLVAAVLVLPAAFGRVVGRSIGTVVLLAALVGTAASVAGLYFSYHVDIASGPAIVLAQAAVFAVGLATTATVAHLRWRGARARYAAADDADLEAPLSLD